MNETLMLTVASGLVAALFGLLVALLSWLGNKIYSKLEELNLTLHQIAGDLHERINGLDRRVTVIETTCHREHGL